MKFRHTVTWNGIAFRPTPRRQGRVDGRLHREGFCKLRSCQKCRYRRAPRPPGMAVADYFRMPGKQASIRRGFHFDIHQHGRRKRRPAEFIRARPQKSHRLTFSRARNQHRFQRHIISTIMAIAAGTFHVAHDHFFWRAAQRLRDIRAQIIGALCMAEDFRHIAFKPRHGTGWPDRGVRQIRSMKAALQPMRGCRYFRIAFFGDLPLTTCRSITQPGRELRLFR